MALDIIKSLLVGICASMPFGPVLIIVLQKTMLKGRNAGFVCGLGSAAVDTVYATAALFALSLVEGYIIANQRWFLSIGGLVVILIGIRMTMQRLDFKIGKVPTVSAKGYASYALQTALCAISNPGAIVMIAALMALFALDADTIRIPVWLFIISVAAGASLYWYAIASVVARFRNVKLKTIRRINKIAGYVIIVFGIVLFVRGIIMFVK